VRHLHAPTNLINHMPPLVVRRRVDLQPQGKMHMVHLAALLQVHWLARHPRQVMLLKVHLVCMLRLLLVTVTITTAGLAITTGEEMTEIPAEAKGSLAIVGSVEEMSGTAGDRGTVIAGGRGTVIEARAKRCRPVAICRHQVPLRATLRCTAAPYSLAPRHNLQVNMVACPMVRQVDLHPKVRPILALHHHRVKLLGGRRLAGPPVLPEQVVRLAGAPAILLHLLLGRRLGQEDGNCRAPHQLVGVALPHKPPREANHAFLLLFGEIFGMALMVCCARSTKRLQGLQRPTLDIVAHRILRLLI